MTWPHAQGMRASVARMCKYSIKSKTQVEIAMSDDVLEIEHGIRPDATRSHVMEDGQERRMVMD